MTVTTVSISKILDVGMLPVVRPSGSTSGEPSMCILVIELIVILKEEESSVMFVLETCGLKPLANKLHVCPPHPADYLTVFRY